MKNGQLITTLGLMILVAARTFVLIKPSAGKQGKAKKCKFCAAPLAGNQCDYCGSRKWRISIRLPLFKFKQ